MQQQSEFPVNAILPYLSFTLSFITTTSCSSTTKFYKQNYLSCQENLGKLSVLMETIEKKRWSNKATNSQRDIIV
jgi:hypothetical protein